VPVIQLCILQWYWYVPATVKVCVYVPPGTICGELKAVAPVGTLVEYTVWFTVSALVQVTVLFTPMMTVIVFGE
jgi:hypothetical protein